MKLFQFGLTTPEYEVPVCNEREIRAAAGILFVGALISFMNALLIGNYQLLQVFVVLFFIEFFIRMVINPAYAPVMIIGRWAVSAQKPEFSGAPQKRFAWAIGLAMSSLMMYLVVFNDIRGPLNLVMCLLCLTFLFFETAFGICLGCTVYNLFSKEKAKLCPGGACEIRQKHEIQHISLLQIFVAVAFVGVAVWLMTSRTVATW